MKIRDIQKSKPIQMQTIAPDKTIHHAIKQLCQFNIGALPVVDAAGSLVGIISERDVLRLCSRDDFVSALSLKVAEVMTKDVVIGVCEDDLDYVMSVMTERRIRHLPVLEDKKLVMIISIGDVVKAQYDQKDSEARYLRDYMAGTV
ncbi:MAG TPA: CBS domain-containing protein [Candidatus Binatia bacterium]|nr:CBS domain-containing protein [Candidatus Binatia bacterium]